MYELSKQSESDNIFIFLKISIQKQDLLTCSHYLKCCGENPKKLYICVGVSVNEDLSVKYKWHSSYLEGLHVI